MRFSLFEYFELNNNPFGQLVYCSVIRLSPFPKDHISGKVCIKLGFFKYGWLDIFWTRNLIEGKVFYMRRIGYFSDPVLII